MKVYLIFYPTQETNSKTFKYDQPCEIKHSQPCYKYLGSLLSVRKFLVKLGKLVIIHISTGTFFRKMSEIFVVFHSCLCQFLNCFPFPMLHLLVLTYHPKSKWYKMKSIYYLIISVGQKSKNSFASCLWLKISIQRQSSH